MLRREESKERRRRPGKQRELERNRLHSKGAVDLGWDWLAVRRRFWKPKK